MEIRMSILKMKGQNKILTQEAPHSNGWWLAALFLPCLYIKSCHSAANGPNC